MQRRLRRRPGRLAALLPLLLGVLLALVACSPEGDEPESAQAPAPIGDQPGAVCGMIVGDQPAPRAQVLHRDGTWAHLCSIGDLLVHLSAPSPHGPPSGIFVEVLEPSEAPLEPSTAPHEQVRAREASFVVGAPRPGIMGPPVLSYRDPATAGAIAARFPEARVLDFDGLRAWWAESREEPP